MTTALNSDFRDAPTVSASSLTKSAIPALAGRVLIAPIFLLSGVSKVTAPAMMIGYIQSVGSSRTSLWPVVSCRSSPSAPAALASTHGVVDNLP
jgi:uncharacterized membrane protein YphA (DoxX/SURF4 family)